MPDIGAALAFDARDVVGESLVWDEARARLVWVDIIGRRIHRLDPLSGAHESWPTPDLVTSNGLRKDGGAIVGLRKEIALWDFGGPFRTIATIEPDRPDTRLNEGVVAPDGSFWVGTMANNIGPDDAPRAITGEEGRLYRVDADGTVTALGKDRFGITNTMVWLPGGRLVTADTTKNALYSYAWDKEAVRLGEGLVFLADFPRGLPDGSCLDAEGYVWNCRVVGGSCVLRIAPDGRPDRVAELPCGWPTSCAFGGPDLGDLYITTARYGATPEALAAAPLSGNLLVCRPGAKGLPAPEFG